LVQHTKRGKNVPKRGEIYQMSIKYAKWPENWPNGSHKIYQHLPSQDPPKFTQIGIFGLKINHLATLIEGRALFPGKEERQFGDSLLPLKKINQTEWHFDFGMLTNNISLPTRRVSFDSSCPCDFRMPF
jgi:hypothetical protein